MKIEGKYNYKASQQQVWDLFNNPQHLKKAIPGCQKLEEREPGKYDAISKIGIAAIKGTYSGKFEVLEPEPPNRYRLSGEGSGTPGFVKGEGIIEFFQDGESTTVIYTGEVQVGGLIAGVGQRLISGIAKMMIKEFYRRLKKELKSLK